MDKLIYFLSNKIYLPIGNLSSYLLKFQFADVGLLARYRTVQKKVFSGFKDLKVAGAFETFPLDSIRVITLSSPIQCPVDPSYIGNTNQVLANQ